LPGSTRGCVSELRSLPATRKACEARVAMVTEGSARLTCRGARGSRRTSAAVLLRLAPSGSPVCCGSAAAAVREVGVTPSLQVGLGDQEPTSARAAASPTRQPGAWGLGLVQLSSEAKGTEKSPGAKIRQSRSSRGRGEPLRTVVARDDEPRAPPLAHGATASAVRQAAPVDLRERQELSVLKYMESRMSSYSALAVASASDKECSLSSCRPSCRHALPPLS